MSEARQLPILPDSIWLRILREASREDALWLLQAASSGLQSLDRVSQDGSLWREVRVDAGGGRRPADLRRIVRFLHGGTVSLELVGQNQRGRGRRRSSAPPPLTTSFLYSLCRRCPTLRRLSLENLVLSREVLQSLPTSIESLSLSGCSFEEGLPRIRALVTSPLFVLKKRQHRLREVRRSKRATIQGKCFCT